MLASMVDVLPSGYVAPLLSKCMRITSAEACTFDAGMRKVTFMQSTLAAQISGRCGCGWRTAMAMWYASISVFHL